MIDETQYKQVVADRIKKIREERELTQADLAKKMNVFKAQISRWETGNHSINLFLAMWLAKVLDVSMDELYGE